MLKVFFRKKQDIGDFIFALEKLTNIAVTKTSRYENKTVLEILDSLEHYVIKFYELKKEDKHKYNQYLISFAKYRIKPKLNLPSPRFNIDGSMQAELAEKDIISETEIETGLFDLFLSYFGKIWESALKVGNEEISAHAIYRIEMVLGKLAQDENNELHIRTILRYLNQITTILFLKYSGKIGDRSIYSSSVHWYTNIVFNLLGQPEKKFNLYYLSIFDEHFLSSAKTIISYGRFEIFQHLISMLIDGISLSSYGINRIWEYGHLIMQSDIELYRSIDNRHNIEEKLETLYNDSENITVLKDLEHCRAKFTELKDILKPYFNIQQQEYTYQIEKDIYDGFDNKIKFISILEIAFAIGSYCLFKEKPDYIRFIWEYKQPPDSDAKWAGHDITPTTINSLMKFYFDKPFFERRLNSWEGHHGQEIYLNRYFILVLARVIKFDSNLYEPEKFEITKNRFGFVEEIDIYRLQDLKFFINDYINITKSLSNEKQFLSELNFSENDIEEIFLRCIIQYFEDIKKMAENEFKKRAEELKPSSAKILEFEDDFVTSFNQHSTIRNMFMSINLYSEKMTYINTKLNRFGINKIDEKAIFFQEWHVTYRDWAKNYGRDLAQAENSFLYAKIASTCIEVTREEFLKQIDLFDSSDDVVILATRFSLYKFKEINENFISSQREYHDNMQKEQRVGTYKKIPVFSFIIPGIDDLIILLNKKQLGQLVQYSPLMPEDNPEFVEKDIFYINIEFFSENRDLLDKFISEPPDWLKEFGNEDEQEKYLKTKVWIRIFEKFDLELADDFEGYIVRLNG